MIPFLWFFIANIKSISFKISASFMITFLSPEIAIRINRCSFLIITDCDVQYILGMVLSGYSCWPHVVTIISWLVYPWFITYLYQRLFSNFIQVSLHTRTLKCSWKHPLLRYFIYCSFTNIWQVGKTCFSFFP